MTKGSIDDGLVYHAGFPNAGEDRRGQGLSLDSLVIRHRASTFFWRLEYDIPQLHWKTGAIVVVDRSLPPKKGHLCVVVSEDGFALAKVWNDGFRDLDGSNLSESTSLWGMVSYCLQGYL